MSEGYFCLEKSADLCLNWHKHSSFKSLPIRGAIARLFAFTLFLWTNESLFRVGTKLWKSSERNIKSMRWRSKCSTEDNKQKRSIFRAWQDSNLQSPDPKSGALSIRPHGLACLAGALWMSGCRHISRGVATWWKHLEPRQHCCLILWHAWASIGYCGKEHVLASLVQW